MQTIRVDGLRWNADSEGEWLCIRTPQARSICESIDSSKQYDAEIKQHREKRSLTANAYYWQLLSKLADSINVSKDRAHNLMLRRYGRAQTLGGKMTYLVIPDTEEAEEQALEAETFHIKPTSQTKQGNDGKTYRTYILLKGSRDYDTSEMSALIDGLVSECKEIGIETLTPEEIARLRYE